MILSTFIDALYVFVFCLSFIYVFNRTYLESLALKVTSTHTPFTHPKRMQMLLFDSPLHRESAPVYETLRSQTSQRCRWRMLARDICLAIVEPKWV